MVYDTSSAHAEVASGMRRVADASCHSVFGRFRLQYRLQVQSTHKFQNGKCDPSPHAADSFMQRSLPAPSQFLSSYSFLLVWISSACKGQQIKVRTQRMVRAPFTCAHASCTRALLPPHLPLPRQPPIPPAVLKSRHAQGRARRSVQSRRAGRPACRSSWGVSAGQGSAG